MDASAIVDVLTQGERGDRAATALADYDLFAPSLIDAEVVSAIARMERARVISASEADAAMVDWMETPVERVDSSGLVPPAWLVRHAVATSDAFYVALSAGLDCPLITSDARLSRAPIPGVDVRLIA